MADGSAFRWMGDCVLIEIKANTLAWPRLGITATKRYGKAHCRNRFKRLVREAFRVLDWKNIQPLDILVKPKKTSAPAGMQMVFEDLVLGIKRFLANSSKKNSSPHIQNSLGPLR